MIEITSEDAFALSLIAQDPERNKDLVETLSSSARKIGEGLIGNIVNDSEVLKAVNNFSKWAKTKQN